MGKYTDELQRLQARRAMKERNHNRIMKTYDSYMDDVYRQYNQQTHAQSMRYLDGEIARLQRLSDKERIDEITASVRKNIAQDSGQTAKAVATEIQKAIKGLKL